MREKSFWLLIRCKISQCFARGCKRLQTDVKTTDCHFEGNVGPIYFQQIRAEISIWFRNDCQRKKQQSQIMVVLQYFAWTPSRALLRLHSPGRLETIKRRTEEDRPHFLASIVTRSHQEFTVRFTRSCNLVKQISNSRHFAVVKRLNPWYTGFPAFHPCFFNVYPLKVSFFYKGEMALIPIVGKIVLTTNRWTLRSNVWKRLLNLF